MGLNLVDILNRNNHIKTNYFFFLNSYFPAIKGKPFGILSGMSPCNPDMISVIA
jgi:hypothetical protein